MLPLACILQGNVFINEYLIIKDLGRGAHGTVKLVYNTQDDMLYAMKVHVCLPLSILQDPRHRMHCRRQSLSGAAVGLRHDKVRKPSEICRAMNPLP